MSGPLDAHMKAIRPFPGHISNQIMHSLDDEYDCYQGLESILMFVDDYHSPPVEVHERLLDILQTTGNENVALQVFNTLKQLQRYHQCGEHSGFWSPVDRKGATKANWEEFTARIGMLVPSKKVGSYNGQLVAQYYLLVCEESYEAHSSEPHVSLLGKLLECGGQAEQNRARLMALLFSVLMKTEDSSYLLARRLLQLMTKMACGEGAEGMAAAGYLQELCSNFYRLKELADKERFLETFVAPRAKTRFMEILLQRDFKAGPLVKNAAALTRLPLSVEKITSYYTHVEPMALTAEAKRGGRSSRSLGIDYLVLCVAHLLQAYLLCEPQLSAEEWKSLKVGVGKFCTSRGKKGSPFSQQHCHFMAAFLQRAG